MQAQTTLPVLRGEIQDEPPRHPAILAIRRSYPIMDIHTNIRITAAARILSLLEALNVSVTRTALADGTTHNPKTDYYCKSAECNLNVVEHSVMPSRVVYCKGTISDTLIAQMRREQPAKLPDLWAAVHVPNMCNQIGNHFLCLSCYCKTEEDAKLCPDCTTLLREGTNNVLSKAAIIFALFPRDIIRAISEFIRLTW